MKVGPSIVRIAALIGDHARAEMLTALMAGQALTATELAELAGVTKQTVSAHLAKLVDARLLAVQSQGRHRYFRLADRDVAQLLESLMGVAYRTGAVRVRPGPREPALRKARVCYDHLAGELGVLVYEGLEQRRWLGRQGEGVAVTRRGVQGFGELGIDVDALSRRSSRAVPGLSRLERRRHHLAGALGAALLGRCCELGWARRERASRVVQFTPPGERALRARFGAVSA